MQVWKEQIKNHVNTLQRLKEYINVSAEEEEFLKNYKTKWGTTPYFASLMDPEDPACPIRRQVVPSMKESENKYGIKNYLVWKENRENEEKRPDSIARQYRDRIAFTVTDVCANYDKH